ncbi:MULTISPECIES: hypothetical protein [unclassified Streptomyces]|uniref:hypothetical protein n=1 Tax=unclassified Streptomyces TaxID=2593676 RepID=UPI0022553DE8|nr:MULTISPECIES: hypothetical protein [unclassified Streptomyces]MCX5049179.1 hypothetical protein [Streptomyces sp. NBC_00474]MCX5056068.1 hypothetical protein [Streptomyces sp. NBC_00452]MCX5247036.1 hypothetical protein [Streptomyces sp. NBC_00201]MCX5287173.1 hypothetical protein [Streptomyces sp. NBC_00183]
MIKQVSHTVAGIDPAGLALALDVAYALHAPVTRAPELVATAPAQMMGLRTTAARPHRRKVPLNRIAAMRG